MVPLITRNGLLDYEILIKDKFTKKEDIIKKNFSKKKGRKLTFL